MAESNLDKEKKDPVVKKKFGIETLKFSFNEKLIQKPKFLEDKKKGFIKYGDKNLFPDYLLNVYFKSGKHNSILNRKIKMISGNGFEVVPFENGENVEESASLKIALKNPHGTQTANEIVKLNTSDQEIIGGLAAFVRWNNKKTKVAAYDYLPFHKVRIAINKETGEEIGFLVSEDWTKINKEEFKPVFYNEYTGEGGFSEKLNKKDKDYKEKLILETVEICYFANINVGTDSYPIPNYFSSIEWILTDSEIGRFSLNLTKNNFLGGFHIGFNDGIPEEDERQKEKEAFKKEHAGVEGENIIMTFSEPESKKVDLNPIPTAGNEDIFESTEKRAQENIFIAHEVVNPVLFGIKEPGSLGGKNELMESLEIFQAVYIDDRQKNINNFFNKIFKGMGVEQKVQLVQYSISKVTEVEPPQDVEAESRAKLRGSVSGVQAIIQINTAVKQGQVSSQSAEEMLIEIFGFKPDTAKKMIE